LKKVTTTALSMALALGVPAEAGSAQVVDFDFAVEQALTTLDNMANPTEYRGVGPGRCGIDRCVPGPFDRIDHLGGVLLGLGVTPTPPCPPRMSALDPTPEREPSSPGGSLP